MSKFIDEFGHQVTNGYNCKNMGLQMGLPRMESYFPGIMRGTYYLIGAPSGCGKTAFVDDKFVYSLYKYWKSSDKKVKIKIRYNSYEIDKVRKIAKLIARHIFEQHGLLLDINFILGKTTDSRKLLPKEIFELVQEAKEEFRDLEEILDIYDIKENPTGILNDIKKDMKSFGEIVGSGADRYFKPYNPDYYYIDILDHASLMKQETDLASNHYLSKKETIDRYSQYCVELRNLYGTTHVVIQQFNRSLESAYRSKFQGLEPSQSDFKETGCTFEDCDIALGFFSPSMFGYKDYDDYDIGKLGKRFIGMNIIKNRDGESDVRVPLKFIGEIGQFGEMPLPGDMIGMKAVYEELNNLSKLKNARISIGK